MEDSCKNRSFDQSYLQKSTLQLILELTYSRVEVAVAVSSFIEHY